MDTVELHKLWSYWPEAHQIYIRYSMIIAADSALIGIPILHGVAEWQHDE